MDIRCFSWCCSRSYWNNFRCVGCIYLDTVWAFSLNLGWCYYTCVWFIRRCEGYLSSCLINWISTNFSCAICSIGWCSCHFITIFVQKYVAIIFNHNSLIFTVHLNSCSCKGWSTCLSGTLDIFRCSWFSCWNSCYNSWCVGRIWCNGCCLTVCVGNSRSPLNCYTSCSTNKVFLRCEGNCSSCRVDSIATFTCYCYSSFISRLTSCWIDQFLACDFSSLIVAQIKGRCLCLRNILNILRYLVCRSNCNWCYQWCVSRWSFSTIHVFTNNGNRWRSTCKAWFWNKGYCSIWCYRVCTNAIHCLRSWAIIKFSWNNIVHRHTAITFGECRFTCLRCTLNICWFSWWCSWSNRSYCWCVSRWSFSTVHVFTDDCHCWSCSCKWFLRYEGYCSIGCYCVSTNTIYSLSSWAIIKRSWNSIVHRHTAVTFGECRFTSLSCTLDISCFSWSCCWCDRNDFRRVSCIHLDTVWAFSLNLGWCYYTCVWFIRRCEGYLSSCLINWISTNFSCTISGISRCACNLIALFIQKCVTILFNGNSFIFAVHLNSCSCKGWCTCLSGTLDIFWSSWLSCWNSSYNSWSISCIRSDCRCFTSCVCNSCCCLNCDTCCNSNKVFFRSKCYRSCSRINCICSFACYGHSCRISRLTCRWIH